MGAGADGERDRSTRGAVLPIVGSEVGTGVFPVLFYFSICLEFMWLKAFSKRKKKKERTEHASLRASPISEPGVSFTRTQGT